MLPEADEVWFEVTVEADDRIEHRIERFPTDTEHIVLLGAGFKNPFLSHLFV